jgi:hypothetical protein
MCVRAGMCCPCCFCRRICVCIFTLLWFFVGTFVGGFIVKGAIAAWHYDNREYVKDMVLTGNFYRVDRYHVLYGLAFSTITYVTFWLAWVVFWYILCCRCFRRGRPVQLVVVPNASSPPPAHSAVHHKGSTFVGSGSQPRALRPLGDWKY